MVLEQNGDDMNHLHEGEHVSGPAAGEYRRRVAATARFAGRTISSAANARRLLAHADPNIHHAEAMTCVWNPDTALCRRAALESGLEPANAPDHLTCRSTCQNLAYTDRDLAQLRQRHTTLLAIKDNSTSPAPLRERAASQADLISKTIQRHQQTRPAHDEDPVP